MPCPCSPFCPYRRKLRADISAAFPSLSAEDLNELIPNKEELNIVKIYTNKGDAVTLYVLHKNPIFIQLEKQLFPTMYTLWAFDDTGHKLSSIGGREMEGEECEEEEQEVQDSPDSAPVETSCQSMQELRLDEHKLLKEEELVEVKEEENIEGEDGDSRSPQEQMDELLLQCFLHALKTKVKKSELPLLTSTFQRNHMVSCCPKGKYLDIKKSSYKNLSKFLQCMQKDHSLIQVKEVKHIIKKISVAFFFFLNNLHSFFSYVNINPTLCDCLLEKSEYKEVEKLKSLADLFSRGFIRMQACHEVLFPGQPPVVKKGQMEPIDITVASRGSNKRYEVHLRAPRANFPPYLQTSHVLHPNKGRKDCVSSVHFFSFITDRYQIPWKYVQGLDKGTKPGKKWQTKPQHKSHMLL
uniref:Eukaryotic translation initiation factor 2D n=1 Tax=Cyprinus carpio TaxID=7962 RepID=A0A8C2IBL6_CYPCA